jgi:prepilin-type N-terminal cleavage/methylation domain-containing protein
MKLPKSQAGFSTIELVIVLVVVAALAFVGYTVYNRQQDKQTSNNTVQTAGESATANDVKPAPDITSTQDLDTADAVLSQTDPGGSNNTDASQLDRELSTF